MYGAGRLLTDEEIDEVMRRVEFDLNQYARTLALYRELHSELDLAP